MITTRQLFLQNVAQTSDFPMLLEIDRAEGIYMYPADGKPYIDLISGIGVSSVGHCHPQVVEAVQQQAARYMHLMVYGEYVQTPQAEYAAALCRVLPNGIDNVYFVNSGSEAVEGALKLAKRYTGRPAVAYFRNAYHGSTNAALSITGQYERSQNFRPLMPATKQLIYNNINSLLAIDKNTACVIVEPVQGEAGVILPTPEFVTALQDRCTETGTLLIADEIQTGFGRTGRMFASERFGLQPDIILMAKSMGGGMPMGAFAARRELMSVLKDNPILGHITTFGGHPVCCAAANAALGVLQEGSLLADVDAKGQLFRQLLQHPRITEIRGCGLMMAVELGNFADVQRFIKLGIENGIVSDWFLYNDTAFRLAPPLIISHEQIEESCRLIIKSLNEL